jgi:hypothetical protein
MKIEFEEWGVWSTAMKAVALYGTVDDRGFGIAFSGKALSELFEVAHDRFVVENAFMRNQEFMNEIARDVIENGRLREDGTVVLYKEDLLPYFERRAATAPV